MSDKRFGRTGWMGFGCAALTLAIGTNVSAAGFGDFSLFSAAAGPLTVEGFEAAPFGAPPGSRTQGTTNLGVSWDAGDDLFVIDFFSHAGGFALSDNDLSSEIDSITATLPGGVFSVGVFINSQVRVRMTAFDAGDNEIESVLNDDSSLNNQFTFSGLVTNTAIARVVFESTAPTDSSDDFALDDFSFGGAAVPAPAALPAGVVLLGMVELLGMRRRGRQPV